MITCMSTSFAKYILSIYGNPADPRSPARLSQKKKQAAAGRALINGALGTSTGAGEVTNTLNTLFATVS